METQLKLDGENILIYHQHFVNIYMKKFQILYRTLLSIFLKTKIVYSSWYLSHLTWLIDWLIT